MKRMRVFIGIVAVLLAAVMVVGCGQAPVLTLSESSVAVNAGASTEITATATDKMGATDTISVESDDESVATVSASGLTITITGVSAGTAAITVTSDSEQSATCDVTVSDIEVMGTWLYLNGDYSTRLEISNSTIKFYSGSESEIATTNNLFQECSIDSFDNTQLNGGDSESSNCGYMAIKYTTPSQYAPQAQNKYGILRWAGLDTTTNPATMSYAEGWLDSDDDWTAEYFDTEAEAITGMTISAGAFSAYPTNYSETEKQ